MTYIHSDKEEESRIKEPSKPGQANKETTSLRL